MAGSKSRIDAKLKQRRALQLRLAGVHWQTIAEQVGYASAESCRKTVMSALKALNHEPAKKLRTLQVERLNQMLMPLWPKVQAGDERAIQTALAVMDRIDRLMGTEPIRPDKMTVEHTHTHGVMVIEADPDAYVAGLQQMAQQISPTFVETTAVVREQDEFPELEPATAPFLPEEPAGVNGSARRFQVEPEDGDDDDD